MESINIIDLHVDVLHIIFKKLKLKDQVNLACAHPNLSEVFRIQKRKQFREFYFNRFPYKIWDPLLSLCGSSVESFIADGDDLRTSLDRELLLLNCATKYCKSLKKILFIIMDPKHLDALNHRLCEFKNLITIDLHINPCVICVNDVTTIQKLKELPNLRKLHLQNFTSKALNSLREVTQLEELYIMSGFLQHLELDIGYICATLKNLRVFVYDGDIEDENSFKALSQFCPELEKLTLFPDVDSLQIPYFSKLKEFTVYFIHCDHQSLNYILGGFGHLYAKQLDELQIYGQNPARYENDELINQCRAIKRFKIREYSHLMPTGFTVVVP